MLSYVDTVITVEKAGTCTSRILQPMAYIVSIGCLSGRCLRTELGRCGCASRLLTDGCFFPKKVDGGFAQYCVFPAEKLFPFEELSWEEATLFEAASCAVHGMDRIKPAVGSTVLLIGSAPTGLCLSPLLKINGAGHAVLETNQGPKMDLAKQLNAADQYVELNTSGESSAPNFPRIQHRHRSDWVSCVSKWRLTSVHEV